MLDEGPSPEDIVRFSDTEGFCPDCGESIYDNTEVCPFCQSAVGGRVLSEEPESVWFEQRWKTVVIVLVILGFMSGALFWLF